jgi:hypothetical protein
MTATLYLKHTGYPVDGRARAGLNCSSGKYTALRSSVQ